MLKNANVQIGVRPFNATHRLILWIKIMSLLI